MNIPSTILLTWRDKNIPDYVLEKWRSLNTNYTIMFYTDDDIKIFLDTHYGNDYVNFFSKIPFGRYKADFFRLCYLYKFGGFYADIDIEPLLSFDNIIDKKTNIDFVSVLSTMDGHIFQAVLASTPNHPLIKMCIDSMLFYGSNIGIDPKDESPWTGHPTKCMYENLEIMLKKTPQYGINNGHILLGKEIWNNHRNEMIFPGDLKFGYSRYVHYQREVGFF